MIGASPFARRKAMSTLVETGGGALVPPAKQPTVRVPPKTWIEPDRRDSGGYVTMDMVRVAKERWEGLRRENGERHPATVAAKSVYDDVRWQWERQEGTAWTGSNPVKSFTVSSKDPATMTNAEIKREKEKLDREMSKITDEMIAAGRGHERTDETFRKDDPLALRFRAASQRHGRLTNEAQLRGFNYIHQMGPGGARMKSLIGPSPFLMKRLSGFFTKEQRGGTCKPGQTAATTGCTPASGDGSQKQPKAKKGPAERQFAKKRAARGKMVSAKREGTGKDARVILSDGNPAPPHITPAMVPPAMKEVRISMDPDADVMVTGMVINEKTGKEHKATIYNEKYEEGNSAIKFARIQEMLAKSTMIDDQIQKARKDPKTAADADCTWLMRGQGTRPGGEKDTKGLAKLYDQPFGAGNINVARKVAPKTKKVTYTGSLTFDMDGKKVSVPIRDQRTASWLYAAKQSGDPEDLHDARYWLQSFGATTLEGRHVVDADDGVHLVFVGKEGVAHDHKVGDPDLAAMLLERASKAGEKGKLFEGVNHRTVTKFTKGLDGGEFTPKDFRTKRAAELAIEEIKRIGDEMDDGTGTKHRIDPSDPVGSTYYVKAVKQVAEKVSKVLGNKPDQAMKSYIPPEVFSVWQSAGGSREEA